MGDINQNGKKHNEDKPKLALVPRALLNGCARAMMFGIDKHGLHDWKNAEEKLSTLELCSKILRHLEDYKEGMDADVESGLSQIDHIAANVAFLAELTETGKIVDDRYKGPLGDKVDMSPLVDPRNIQHVKSDLIPKHDNPCLEQRMKERDKAYKKNKMRTLEGTQVGGEQYYG